MRHSFSCRLARIVKSPPGRSALGVLAILGFVISGNGWSAPPTEPPVERKNPVKKHGPFTVRHFSGKCITFGSTAVDLVPAAQAQAQTTDAPVFLSKCANESFGPDRAQTAYQHIVVAEINSRHEVILMAGNKVIGVLGNFLAAQAPLVLQDYVQGTSPATGQIFALDGDSIILAANRELVVEAKNGRGANGTPLVLGNRDIEDAEFWDFMAVSGRYEKPTDGFVLVPLDKTLVDAVQAARWGDVVVVDNNIELVDQPPLEVQAGVTIRGNRRATLLGPEIFANYSEPQAPGLDGLFIVYGNNARITGMRLRGPTRDPDAAGPFANGIATYRYSELPIKGLIVDHNDLSDWTVGAVAIYGIDDSRTCDSVILKSFIDPQTRLLDVRVVRNFIHHNRKSSLGYGVVTGSGGFASIDSNTFLDNRHSIAADGTTYTGYSAWFNLVLSHATGYNGNNYQQDFDMHGSDGGYGFPGGAGIDIVANTFLGTNRDNLYIRGAPCGSPWRLRWSCI
ncbi:MAG: hypothetical protein ACMG6H_12505, partial [Acidobacteriota bacterium]